MRDDSVGMFWQDELVAGTRNSIARVQPPIPETGWRPPRDFPNLSAALALAVDTETYDPHLLTHGPGWARNDGHIVGVSVATHDGARWYFPMRHTVEPEWNLDPAAVLSWLRDTLGDPRQPKVGANLIYDVGWLRQEGVPVAGELCDVQFAEALLDERAEVNLDTLAMRYLGLHKETSLLYQWCSDFYGGDISGKQRANIWRAPPRLVGPYAEADALLPMHILPLQARELQAQNLYELFRLECELIPLLIEMRFRGVRVDLDRAEQLRGTLARDAGELQKRLRELVGFDVNVDANDSLGKAWDKLGIPYSRTKPTTNYPEGKPSFPKDYLEDIAHPAAELVLEIRKLNKLRGTFVESYILNSHVNGRVHCQFHPLRGDENGARSGRLSSSDPNLQNIPARDKKLAPLVRGLFLPDYGKWRRYDYSQIEYRGLIHYAVGPGAEEARQRYRDDPRTDYHEYVIQLIKALADMLLDRKPAKNINFGLVYGMGEPKLAHSLGLSPAEAKRLFAAYHTGVPFVRSTMQATAAEAEALGYITTILGRRSRFDLWEPARRDWKEDRQPGLPYELAIQQYGMVKRALLHKALNRRLQGTAADLMKVAMVLSWRHGIFKEIGVPHVTVHDELGFSWEPDAQPHAWVALERTLENALPFSIPIKVEVETGPDWGHLE